MSKIYYNMTGEPDLACVSENEKEDEGFGMPSAIIAIVLAASLSFNFYFAVSFAIDKRIIKAQRNTIETQKIELEWLKK